MPLQEVNTLQPLFCLYCSRLPVPVDPLVKRSRNGGLRIALLDSIFFLRHYGAKSEIELLEDVEDSDEGVGGGSNGHCPWQWRLEHELLDWWLSGSLKKNSCRNLCRWVGACGDGR